MKLLLPVLFLFISTLSFGQKVTEELFSKKLNEKRDITIILPESYDSSKNKKYPLLLVLDGDYLLDPFSGVFSYATYWDDLPETIIIGVDQADREKDTETSEDTGIPQENGDRFYEFIELELMPYLQQKYRLAPFKVVAGHDWTAGFLNFFLYKNNPLFQGYIAISPELPANIETILPEKLAQLQKDTYYYYLATADGDVDRIRKSAVQLDGLIKPIDNKSLKYRYDNFGNASHYSLVPMAIPQAVYHIFGEYQPISSVEYQTKIATLQSGYVDYLKAKYAQLDKNLGLEVPVRINDLKAIEAAIMKNGMFEELKELAKIAKKNYPKTIIGEYYEGLYYEKTGNTQKAIKIYLNGYTFSSIADYTKEFMVEKAQALKTE